MRTLLLCICCLALASVATAQKTPVDDGTLNWSRVECGLQSVCWEWDGSFTQEQCDDMWTPVWMYGTDSTIPTEDCYGNPIGDVLGTVLGGDYPNDSGDRAILGGEFTVAPDCYLLEICHFYDIETSYDGGNVEVIVGGSPVVIDPVGGYPDDLIGDSTSYYAWCVDMQPGFTGHDPATFVLDCFDLSQFMGETVQIAVKFGSDSSVTYPGWFISSVMAGSDVPTPTTDTTWGRIRMLY